MVYIITGTSKDDKLTGTSNDDAMYGLSGNDTIDGNNGNDLITGGAASSIINGDSITIDSAFKGQVSVEIPRSSALNPVGMYKVDASGNITDVKILWGGSLLGIWLGGQSITKTYDVDLKSGERYGFFILSDGYISSTLTSLLNDSTIKWDLRDSKGGTGQVSDTSLTLYRIDPLTGLPIAVSIGLGGNIYHSTGSAEGGYKPNPDGAAHAQSTVDYAQGVVTIGLESGSASKADYKDAIIKLSMGIDNTLELGEPGPAGNGGDDVLNGGDGDDKVLGMAGNDVVTGGNGQDRLWGNTGNDKLSGDGGDDWVSGGEGNDTLNGGQGQDKLMGRTGNDVLNGDDGDDSLWGDDGDDVLNGNNNNDTLTGGKGADKLYGGSGDDKLYGDTGNDYLSGGDNNDQFKGGDGNDTILGDSGNDVVSGGKGDDSIEGGSGNDNLKGDTGRDIISGGDDNDVIAGGDGDDTIAGGNGNDTISAGKGNDSLRDDSGNDQVKGDSGNDVIVAGTGNDTYDGGSGNDTIDFSELTSAVKVDLEAHTASGSDRDVLKSIENVVGTSGADVITGDKAANILSGGAGNDRITGARGSDTLSGGNGNDSFVWESRKDVTGEKGLDKFVDTVKDFSKGDVLDFTGFKLDTDKGVDNVLKVYEADGATHVVANFGGAAFVEVVVLTGVTGFDLASHIADGSLLV